MFSRKVITCLVAPIVFSSILILSSRSAAWVPQGVSAEKLALCEEFPVLFGDREWRGRTYIVLDSRDIRDGFNDSASSLCVPARWRVDLYEHHNYGGLLDSFSGPSESLGAPLFINFYSGSNLNDKVSSIRVFYNDGTNGFRECYSSSFCSSLSNSLAEIPYLDEFKELISEFESLNFEQARQRILGMVNESTSVGLGVFPINGGLEYQTLSIIFPGTNREPGDETSRTPGAVQLTYFSEWIPTNGDYAQENLFGTGMEFGVVAVKCGSSLSNATNADIFRVSLAKPNASLNGRSATGALNYYYDGGRIWLTLYTQYIWSEWIETDFTRALYNYACALNQ